MKIVVTSLIIFLLSEISVFAQVGIKADNSAPDPSAMLDVKSSTKGTLLTRMTVVELASIANPANGLQVFCTTDGKMYIYVAAAGVWKELAYGAGTITPPFSCGISFTINHSTSGGVAPVDKSVTYATVNNIPGELAKCWITRNLGASQQATGPGDPTEASAGWYWQFNCRQGYKHDGTTRTPSSTWITGINEGLNWIADNDPCTLELGPAWRIPTYTEWNNVIANGGWTNWNGPYGSALKLHAAGALSSGSGSLAVRGSYGFYWSSAQYNTVYAWVWRLQSDLSLMDFQDKAAGYPNRCIRNF
jgi:hypothetical protein